MARIKAQEFQHSLHHASIYLCPAHRQTSNHINPTPHPHTYLYLPASVAQLDARPTGDQVVAGSTIAGSDSFVEINYEIFCTFIRSFPRIQEGQLSIYGERICTILVNRLED